MVASVDLYNLISICFFNFILYRLLYNLLFKRIVYALYVDTRNLHIHSCNVGVLNIKEMIWYVLVSYYLELVLCS